MTLASGTKLGPYEIVEPIGAGGMGEVYRARDPRLNRDVAIKVSGSQFSERFEREVLDSPAFHLVYVGRDHLTDVWKVDAPHAMTAASNAARDR